ncbi:MAG: penicillin acylase family protein [Acidobacteria bacterium]|nr:penicillin acylase family protein [Acidobacteriota bacterium]
MRKFNLYVSLPMVLILCFHLLIPSISFSKSKSIVKKSPIAKKSSAQVKETEFSPQELKGLAADVEVIEDELGIPHVFAKTNEDVFFMQGVLHARDRFFQMDTRRRMLDGSLAEILGAGPNNRILRADSTARGSGLYLAAQDSLAKYSPEVLRFLKAYANGVNSYLANNPLPEEYQQLKITKARPWTELDSIYVGKALAVSLAFDLIDLQTTAALKTYQDAGKAQGFDGTKLFFDDMFRLAPFDPTYVIPDALGQKPSSTQEGVAVPLEGQEENEEVQLQRKQWGEYLEKTIHPSIYSMAQNYLEAAKESPLFANAVKPREQRNGSNWFILSGKVTESGAPMITGDQHFDLENAPTWYQIQLNVTPTSNAEPPLNVTGVSVCGAPGVALGFNDNLAWQATITVFDFTDVYQDKIELQLGPNPIVILNNGKKQQVILRNETFKVNQIADGKTDNLVDVPKGTVQDQFGRVPFRNNGPIIGLDFQNSVAMVVQQVGFGPTQEIQAFLELDRAKTLKDFEKGLQKLGGASVNMGVVTTKGEVAYYTTGELPLRSDLEKGAVSGVPPSFIRDGSGANDWQPLRKKQKFQTLPTEILPFKEMPKVINPPTGFVVSANNDPTGDTGDNNSVNTKRKNGKSILYLSSFYASGLRASQLTSQIKAAIASNKKISVDMARRFQAAGKMRDAELFLPFIRQAFDNARKADAPIALSTLAGDLRVKEAMDRFNKWDLTTPTGLRNGYDSFVPFNQVDPTDEQINNSACSTIYSIWRSQMVRNVLDAPLAPKGLVGVDGNFGQTAIAALFNLLSTFPTKKGVGASGISFFTVPELAGQSPEAQRDFILLRSLKDGLDELAGPNFTLAYSNSQKLSDYRWGKIHRLFIPHILGVDFSLPSNTGNFQSPFPGLYGLPRDGGYEVPNACSHPIRAKNQDDFMFNHSPTHRFTAVTKPSGVEVVDALPGGQSGDRKSKFYDNQLSLWLTADVKPLLSDKKQLMATQPERVLIFTPAKEK